MLLRIESKDRQDPLKNLVKRKKNSRPWNTPLCPRSYKCDDILSNFCLYLIVIYPSWTIFFVISVRLPTNLPIAWPLNLWLKSSLSECFTFFSNGTKSECAYGLPLKRKNKIWMLCLLQWYFQSIGWNILHMSKRIYINLSAIPYIWSVLYCVFDWFEPTIGRLHY